VAGALAILLNSACGKAKVEAGTAMVGDEKGATKGSKRKTENR
jgi:hypothetical protein